MITSAIAAGLVLGAVVWPESSLRNVYPETPPRAADSVQIHAARGEWESIQLCIRSDAESSVDARIEASGLGETVPAPTIYVLDYVTIPPAPSHPFGPVRVPDLLVPGTALELPPDTTRAFWLTYRVPLDAEPGEYEGEILVRVGEESFTMPVRCDVYGFSLPEISSLRSFIPLNRGRIGNQFGIVGDALANWTPIYDALTGYRLAFSVWDNPDRVPRLDEGSVDTPLVQSHLQYAAQQWTASAIDVGFGMHGLEPVRPAESGRFIPPADVYLYDMGHWLRGLDWMSRAVVMVPPPESRAQWQAARQRSFEIFTAEPDIARILAAPLHPFFERYLDIWPLPLDRTNPYAIARLRDGRSLHVSRPAGVPVLTASGSGASLADESYDTHPADAFDGSFFSHWVSAPGAGKHPWLEIELDRQVATNEIRIGWVPGYESTDIRLRTSFDGRTFSTADVGWEYVPPANAYEPSWSVGDFSAEKRFVSMRLEFRDLPDDAPVAIADILLTPAIEEEPAPIERVQPWLAAHTGDFPFLGLPGNPAEPRLLPWVCWSHRLLGFVHPGVANWPPSWGPSEAFPADWPVESVLMYPVAGILAPSVRLMRLRDGMEDYEYFRNLEQMAMIFGARNNPDIEALRKHDRYTADMPYGRLYDLADGLLEQRRAIGEAMNELLKTEGP